MVEYEHTLKLLDDMGLTTAAEQLDAMLDEAARNDEITYLGFLHNLLLQEEEARKRRSLQTRLNFHIGKLLMNLILNSNRVSTRKLLLNLLHLFSLSVMKIYCLWVRPVLAKHTLP